MQKRLMSRSRLFNSVAAALMAPVVASGRLFARSLTRDALARVGEIIMSSVFLFLPRYRALLARNVARALDTTSNSPLVRDAVAGIIRHHGRSWADFFWHAERDPSVAVARVRATPGWDDLQPLLAQGNGFIVLGGHLGYWEMGAFFRRTLGRDLVVVYHGDRFRSVEQARSTRRRRFGLDEIRIDTGPWAALPALRALREGKLLVMMGDRRLTSDGVRVPFFGHPAIFPPGPFELALATRAPLVPFFLPATDDGGFLLEFGRPIKVDDDRERRQEAIADAVRNWVNQLEDAIRRHPEQWACFDDPWGDA